MSAPLRLPPSSKVNGERGYFQSASILSRVLDEAPYLARCSDDKTAARVRPRHFAVRYPYMQINRAGMVSWLIFDLDHNDPWGCWEDNGLPMPNLIVRDRKTNHAHLYYAIAPVCTSVKARSGPIEYMKAIYEAFAARLRADPSYRSGPVAKTPGHPWWDTTELHTVVYELNDLAERVELAKPAPWSKGVQLDDIAHSRHCMLFEHVRHYAYSIVNRERAGGTFEGFSRLLDAYAATKNRFTHLGFAVDLAHSSLRATVRSIARWTWNRYTGSGRCNRGTMQLDPDLPLPERQKLAAQRTHTERSKATEGKLKAICANLLATGKAITQARVAALAGLARQTVAKYRHVLEEAMHPAPAPRESRPAAAAGEVNFAAYQVPAASGGPAAIVPFPGMVSGSSAAVAKSRLIHTTRQQSSTSSVIAFHADHRGGTAVSSPAIPQDSRDTTTTDSSRKETP